ncbi:multiple-like 3 [Ilyonectria robusta]|uniref:multiple-like 3 n=1 Tax=Ilyonectria robusta TaxID=1079257 RepID=UPI001E8CF830|nr:multiple-like 3 [Ilyonectria robusta]KAH8666161.1 multiple-like 3 [Ilyonectria robusta]
MTLGWAASLSPRLSRRLTTNILAITVSCLISCLTLFLLLPDAPPLAVSWLPSEDGSSLINLPECGPERTRVASPEIWNAAEAKYRHLMDDKFTITILTYNRPYILNDTLEFLTSEMVPSLHEILIVWNNQDEEPPMNYLSAHNVSVRYIETPRNSMNMKFVPYPDYQTKAVLLHDDDLHYELLDMEFAFQAWRKQGQYQIVGAYSRCVVMDELQRLVTHNCADLGYYNLMLTGLLFTHISYLDYFSSNDRLMRQIRNYIDSVRNCDDIAFNYMAQMLSCTGPMQATGDFMPFNALPPVAISTSINYIPTRRRCVNDFKDMFGYMPLENTTGHLTRGTLIW